MKLFTRIKNIWKFTIIYIKRIIRIIKGGIIIDVIGDSHSLLFQHPYFRIHYIGPATAFNLNSKTSTTNSRDNIFKILQSISKRKVSTVLLVFGEIDCRIHIYKAHKEKKISIEKAIEDTINSYIEFIKDIKTKFPKIKFIIFNVVPPGEQANLYGYKYYANRDMMLNINNKFNKCLKGELEKLDIPFIDIYNKLIDSHNLRKKELVFDDIHYSNKILPMVMPEIKKFF